MEALKNLPIGIQEFEKLRTGNYLYVDKTAYVHQLVTTGCYYFLSRPRRFGKSILLSTLEAYFLGKKELFKGLAIEHLEQKWEQYPILHLDLNTVEYNIPESLEKVLNDNLARWEELYGSRSSETTFGLRFCGVIRRACERTGRQVVILVDEYDKPILQTIENDTLQERYCSILRAFYAALKTMDGCIKFALLTGVTKFGKLSVFSDLNNLKDISMRKEYAAVCGITDQELDTVLVPYVQRLAHSLERPVEDVRKELRSRYDGYHFLANSIAIYNPFSVLNSFDSNIFNNYWFETGTPSFLVFLLKKHHYKLDEISGTVTSADVLNSIDTSFSNPIPVIYQSGYLTIKDYDARFDSYTLGFPNKEVEEGFLNFLLPFYASIDKSQSAFQISNFVREVEGGQTEAFLTRLSSFFADTPYELVKDLENHYQNVVYLVTKLLGFYVKAEYHTSAGRIDLLLQTDHYTYVMEFKLDGTADEALQQIYDKRYAQPFETDTTRQLIRVGVNFSSKMRGIERWVIG